MTFEELTKEIHDAGLYPIRVESASDEDTDLSFVGTLSEYLQAVKAIGATVVFLSTCELSEHLFSYQGEIDDDEDDQDDEYQEEDELDLCLTEPKLSSFKEKVGMAGSFNFSVPMASTNLKFEISEPWWLEFVQLWGSARQTIEDQHSAEMQELELEEEENKRIVLSKLQELIDDEQFVCLPTQRAMRAYAIERIPELNELDSQEVKNAIQDITATIQARKLSRK